MCDGWGYVPLDQAGSKLLFQVISDCYEQRTVIITTNLEFSKWVNVFYDEQMTAAILTVWSITATFCFWMARAIGSRIY
jgi:DNA replication protein DnaC